MAAARSSSCGMSPKLGEYIERVTVPVLFPASQPSSNVQTCLLKQFRKLADFGKDWQRHAFAMRIGCVRINRGLILLSFPQKGKLPGFTAGHFSKVPE